MLVNQSTYIQAETNFVELFNEVRPLILEDGSRLNKIRTAYQTYGKLNNEGTNAILVCHALTGNAHAAGISDYEESDKYSSPDFLNKYSKMFKRKPGWWDSLIGPGKVFDTDKYFVICPNVLGSCYGTTGPASINEETTKAYQADFPQVTVRDMVRVQKELLDGIGINKLKTISGGSLGGMQVLEWAVMYPDYVESIIPVATSAKHSPWAIGISEVERQVITTDPNWNSGYYGDQPITGLAIARKIAMLSYRSFPSFEKKFGRTMTNGDDYFDNSNKFQVNSYLNHQGDKLVKRFDANTYMRLADAMDFHDLGYERENTESVLKSIKAKTLTIAISSDLLYPKSEQQFIAKHIPDAFYAEIESMHGHDGFLIEFNQMDKIIRNFLLEV